MRCEVILLYFITHNQQGAKQTYPLTRKEGIIYEKFEET